MAFSANARFALCMLLLSLCLQSIAPHAFAQLTWSFPKPLNTTAATDISSANDLAQKVATDGKGLWIAVWQFSDFQGGELGDDTDILFARSTDNGSTWTDPETINPDAFVDTVPDESPSIATDGQGLWTVVWDTGNETGGLGPDRDIVMSQSFDDGLSWTPPVPVNNDATIDETDDRSPVIETDDSGTWVTAWERALALPECCTETYIVHSSNDGATWSDATTLRQARTNTPSGVATDAVGNWIVAVVCWDSSSGRNNVCTTRSTDNGSTWGPLTLLNNEGEEDAFSHDGVSIATSGTGTWIASWIVRSTSTNHDPYFGRSTDNGLTWSTTAPLISDPDADFETAFDTSIATDGDGNWITAWGSTNSLGQTIGGDHDIIYVRSDDDGLTWLPAQPLNSNAEVDQSGVFNSGGDFDAIVKTDDRGNWLGAWTSTFSLNGIGPDQDLLVANGFFTGYLTGIVTNTYTGRGAQSAIIRVVRPGDPTFERLVPTDANGRYWVDHLPAGTYSAEAYSDIVEWSNAEVTITEGAVTKQDFALDRLVLSGAAFGAVFGEDRDDSAANRVPLVGVKVTAFIDGSLDALNVTYSANTGGYAINGLAAKQEGQDIRVRFEAQGFVTDDRLLNISSDANQESNPTLEKADIGFPGQLVGAIVRADTEAPIDDALVDLDGQVSLSRTTEPGEKGVYVFDALPESNYTVRASAAGFITQTVVQKVSTDLGTINFLDFRLAPEDSSPEEDNRDVDGDGRIDAIDVQLVINAVLGTANLGGLDADVNGDNERNALDVQEVINGALGT
jgi:hypothetical protein